MIKKIFAFAAMFVMTFTFAACNKDKKDYTYLKEEIIGVWCEEGGPKEMVLNDGQKHYMLFEFTEDGIMYSHAPAKGMPLWNDAEYTIEENYFIVDGQRCNIEIEGDILTMTNVNGDTRYQRMTVEEVSYYGAYCMGKKTWEEQQAYLGLDGSRETPLPIGGAFEE